jgi:hypothetical protein
MSTVLTGGHRGGGKTMAREADWTLVAAELIVKRVLQGAGDRSDMLKIQRLIEEACPFKKETLYYQSGDGPKVEVLQMHPDIGIVVPSGKTTITLLPAIPGHSHVIGQDGKPTCGCQYFKPA